MLGKIAFPKCWQPNSPVRSMGGTTNTTGRGGVWARVLW